jgi:hypothetical protein
MLCKITQVQYPNESFFVVSKADYPTTGCNDLYDHIIVWDTVDTNLSLDKVLNIIENASNVFEAIEKVRSYSESNQ